MLFQNGDDGVASRRVRPPNSSPASSPATTVPQQPERRGRGLGHVPALDSVRAVAVLLIIVHHTYSDLVPRGSAFVDLHARKDPVLGASWASTSSSP